MGFENMCIACLATEVKMYSLNESSIIAYTNLTGITCIDDSEKICFECMFVLSKVERFRLNCLRAYETLTSSEHSLDHITWNHEPKLKLTEPMVLYVGPDHIVLSDSDDDDDAETSKPFNSETHLDLKYLIQKCDIKSDTKEQTCNQGLDFNNKKLHISSLKVAKGAIIIDPCIRESKIEMNTAFSDSEIDDFTYYHINTQETRNIGDKIKRPQHNGKSRSVSKLGKSKPTVKKQLKVSKKNKFSGNRNKNISEIMSITALNPEDAKIEIELRKQSRSYINNTLKCDLCFKAFNFQRTLSNHMKKHNNDFGYECDYCHIRMKTRKNISGHIFGSHMYKFTCKKCPYVCYGRNQAYAHTREHTGETFACRICNKEFRHSNTLAVHMRVSHFAQLDEVVCAICGDVFVSKLGLNSHMNFSHPQESNSRAGPACSECGVHFSSHTAYRRHLVLSKRHTVSNGCSLCGETFSDEVALKTHLRETHPERAGGCLRQAMPAVWPAPCPQCSVILNNRKEYRQHMPAVHPSSTRAKIIQSNNKKTRGNNYVCEVCGLGFKLQCLLSYHMATHTGQRPYSCGACAETFGSRPELRRHRARRHLPRKVCPQCGKTFADNHILSKHRRVVHLKILPYSCSQCDKKFHDPCQLRYHLRHTHEKVPWPIPNRKTKRTAAKKNVASKRSLRERGISEDSNSSTCRL